MVAYFDVTRIQPVNADQLTTELRAAVATITGISARQSLVTVISETALSGGEMTIVTNLVAAHDPAILTGDQQIEASRQIALTAKTYIRNQLMAGNNNIGQIFTTMKSFIDSNSKLLTMQNTNIALMSLAYGWNATNVTNAGEGSSNLIKAQYIEAAKSIVAAVA